VSGAAGATLGPAFGVVVLNWNRADETVVCLESLAAASPLPARVAVVDNHSADDSAAVLERWIRDRGAAVPMALLRAPRNLGFPGGNNIGLADLRRDARLTHFLLLNNDATVAPDFFAAMADALAVHPAAGLLGPTIYEVVEGAEPKLWYAGGIIEARRARARHLERSAEDGAPRLTGFITGCALVISREALETLGPLAECYFPLYLEDVEYSYRAARAGLPLLYVPRAKADHRRGATVGRYETAPNVVFWNTRHEGYFARRNLRGPLRAEALTFFALSYAARSVRALARGRPRVASALLRGMLHGLLGRGAWRAAAPDA